MMLNHEYTPTSFGKGVIVPLIKDSTGDPSSLDNYRPITLSPTIAKVFEAFILQKFPLLTLTDDLQFGFKSDLGCRNAIFALRQVVKYFNDRQSSVFVASVDASKAFDRVNHCKLFTILINRGLPLFIVNLLSDWYSKLSAVVRWNGSLSTPINIYSGVRQGGILSPFLFNIYVNDMICKLRSNRLGCHLRNVYLGCIMYADDLLLLSSSVKELQLMLDICSTIGNDLDIKFNSSKSMCMVIGRCIATPATMYIDKLPIPWVDELSLIHI